MVYTFRWKRVPESIRVTKRCRCERQRSNLRLRRWGSLSCRFAQDKLSLALLAMIGKLA
jgi:hypothetical protein